MQSDKKAINLLWLHSGGCGGCSQSLLGCESPDLFTQFDAANIKLLWHPAISEGGVLDIIQQIIEGGLRLDILCLEGAVMQGPDGTGMFHRLSGSERATRDWLLDLVPHAGQVVAMGSCAAFGGMTSAGGNPAEACGLQFDGAIKGGLLGEEFTHKNGLPVINIAGCPPHPNWMMETLMQLADRQMPPCELDELGRPASFASHLAHHGCPRNEFYEYKASAAKRSDLGCLMEHLGCLGTQAHADCNLRLWNGEGSCLRGGFSCINCTAPLFEEPDHNFMQTAKIAGIPVGLPTDMPKAWYVALASLSKAATPTRLKINAHSDHIRVEPGKKRSEQ